MNNLTIPTLLIVLITACQPAKKKPEQDEIENIPVVSLELVWQTDSVMHTPEAVRYNAEEDVIYVMNMGVEPNSKKDGDGTIAKISVGGKILEREWVTGLNSPKGANYQGGKLYVADIDELVKIDIATATIEEKYASINPKFLNDTDIDSNGDVYFTDTGSDQVLKFINGEVKVWQKIEGLNPNGVFIEEGRVLVVSYDLGELYAFNKQTGAKELLATGMTGGDGIVAIEQGYLVSTWPGEIFFVSKSQKGGGATKILDTKEKGLNAADITIVPNKKLLIVPTFLGNSVCAYKIKVSNE